MKFDDFIGGILDRIYVTVIYYRARTALDARMKFSDFQRTIVTIDHRVTSKRVCLRLEIPSKYEIPRLGASLRFAAG